MNKRIVLTPKVNRERLAERLLNIIGTSQYKSYLVMKYPSLMTDAVLKKVVYGNT